MLCLIITVWTAKYSFVTQFQCKSSSSSRRKGIEMIFKRTLSTGGLKNCEHKKNGKEHETITKKKTTQTNETQKSQNKIVKFVHSPITVCCSSDDDSHVFVHTLTILGGAVSQVKFVTFLLHVKLIQFSSQAHRLLLIEMKTSVAHIEDQLTHTVECFLEHSIHDWYGQVLVIHYVGIVTAKWKANSRRHNL